MCEIDKAEYSWINFKLRRDLHLKFSVIIKNKGLNIKEVMNEMIAEYVSKNIDDAIKSLMEND